MEAYMTDQDKTLLSRIKKLMRSKQAAPLSWW
jgi:hypothetical protein